MRNAAKSMGLAAALAWLAACAGAQAEPARVALVVGEGGYASAPTLANPPNDARDIAQELRALGFEVSLRIDLGRSELLQAVGDFGAQAAHAEVAVFYYGGHGVQLQSQNYLIPVDVELHKAADIARGSVPLNAVISAMAAGKGRRLIFLDACRENPLKADEAIPGLARLDAPADFLIAYATRPNAVAFDGAGRNSPFAQALLANLTRKGVDVSNLMISVTADVFAHTGGEQTPVAESLLTRQVFLAGEGAADESPESALWRAAAPSRDADLLQAYLTRYPTGAHASDARSLISAAAAKPGANRSTEEELWRIALTTREPTMIDLYRTRFPDGAHAQDAEELAAEALAAAKDPGFLCDRLATHPHDASGSAPGVELEALAAKADAAIDACERARKSAPRLAHYEALLARANYAAKRYDEAARLYKSAAAAGDARAIWSLGRMIERGDHMPKDVAAAYALYHKAAERGLPDAAIDVAVALSEGRILPKDVGRAYQLLKSAADAGSAIATFDLARFAEDGTGGRPEEALALYRRAAAYGEPNGHRAAAVLLDEGRHVAKDPEAAAAELLQAVAGDAGGALGELTAATQSWSPATVSAVQRKLKSAGFYNGAIDGRSGPALAPALKRWRLLGDPRRAQSTK
jgi:hypothetical protein